MPEASRIAWRRGRRGQGGEKSMVCPCHSTIGLAGHLFGGEGDHLFSAAHHIFVVGVCLVKLELCEFGIVFEADAFVAEIAPDLVDRGKAADDQPLQIQLEADAQIKVLVELIVVGDEGLCSRAAVDRLQDRRLDLEEAGVVQIGAQARARPRPRARNRSRALFVGQQVDVSPAIADLRVGARRAICPASA